MAEQMRYADASATLEAVRVLEGLEKSGDITATEKAALDRYRASQGAAESEVLSTRAQYRGLQSGAAMNFDDEIAGARAAAGEFVRSRDTAKASEAYRKYRDLIRQKNEAAKLIDPEAYAKGSTTGAIGVSMVPAVGATRVMQGLGYGAQALTGALTGALTTAAPEFGKGEGGFGSRMGEISPAATATGAVLGAAGPVIGAVAGQGVRSLQDLRKFGGLMGGYSAGATQRVGKALGSAERGGTDIERYLANLGPEGTIADIAGSPRQMAQGLATMSGEGSDLMRRRLDARAEGASPRIKEEFDTRIAGPSAAFDARAEQAARKATEFGPLYDAAKAYPDPIDVGGLRKAVVTAAKDQAEPTRNALAAVLRDLGAEDNVSALRLHNTRVALNDAKEAAFRAGEGGKASTLKTVLDAVDRRLDNIEGYAKARGGWADASALERAVDDGRAVFSGGPVSALSPQELTLKLDGMTEPQIEAFRKGAREYIGALMGTSRNDAPAAWQAFQKDWNADKLRLILGDADANAVMRRLESEATFSQTRGDVLSGSQTAFREEGRDALAAARDPGAGNAPSVPARATKALSTTVNKAVDAILYGPRRQALNQQIGDLLTMSGAERDQAVAALLRGARGLDDKTRAQQIVGQLTTAGILTAAPNVTE